MEHLGMLPGSRDEIPEELRCKRTDGKQWRCSALSMPDKTVCEKHYIQAKKRAASSAMRASQKKARRGSLDDADIYLESRRSDDPEMSTRSLSPMNGGGLKYREKYGNSQPSYVSSPEVRKTNGGQRDGMQGDDGWLRAAHNNCAVSKEVKNLCAGTNGDCYGKSSESGEAEGLTCHQCRRSDKGSVVWCTSCDRRGYCASCISQWYADIPVEDIRKVCPACQGICNCKVCLRADNLVKTKVQEIARIDKLRYLHGLLSFVLPVLKQIYSEQCFELAMEARVQGKETDIPRAKIRADEQMCCNLCRTPIFDFHRHCTHCSYDLCINCCRDIRRSSLVGAKGESVVDKRIAENLTLDSANENVIDFSSLYPKWKANPKGSIPCPPVESGGCGSSELALRRILKINWAVKLVKFSEEIVTGCKVSDHQGQENCGPNDSGKLNLYQCSHRDGAADNLLYFPTSEDLKLGGIRQFHRHWVKGEPVVVKHVFDQSLASSWDPMSILRGIQETADEGSLEENTIVKAMDLLKQSEVEIELTQFIRGYSEGLKYEDGRPRMLVLKDWPHPDAWEEFILCQRPEFVTNLPLVEFIHSKWGLLNLAAKLPRDSMLTEAGPRILISYGTRDELGRGDPMMNLHLNMNDVVNLLMHSVEANIDERHQLHDLALEGHACRKELNGSEMPYFAKKRFLCSRTGETSGDIPQNVRAGAIWDVFRRQDVKKLNEFLSAHWEKFGTAVSKPGVPPVYEQCVYLDKHQIRKLKEEYNIEPWTFEQHVGEAVFVPAGCYFQVRNLQSTVQLSLDFLSPESLGESYRMAQEIRCLPDDHDAKLRMWEVAKMSLYAASSAIREVQKITLDPKFSSDTKFDDRNLTAMVSENLERITKRRRVACT